jgi:Family of unknown function (DUF5681)
MTNQNRKPQASKKTNAATRFKKGVSGNPAGRPKRVGNAIELRNQILTDLPDLIEYLFEKAHKGDMQAAKLLLERALPPIKPQPPPVTLHIPNEDIASQVQFLFAAASQGQIPAETATQLAQIAQVALSLSIAQSAANDSLSNKDLEIANASYASYSECPEQLEDSIYPFNETVRRSVTITEITQNANEKNEIIKMDAALDSESPS